jgi:hypothetical protein
MIPPIGRQGKPLGVGGWAALAPDFLRKATPEQIERFNRARGQ